MKISRGFLRRLIREETERVLQEQQATGEGTPGGKTDRALRQISKDRAMRDGTLERDFVRELLQAIVEASDADVSPWDGEFWNDSKWDVVFNKKEEEEDPDELGGQLSTTSVVIIKKALESKGHKI